MQKKLFFLMPFAALALASCSNDESVSEASQAGIPDGAISMRALFTGSTRGNVSYVNTLGSFRVLSDKDTHAGTDTDPFIIKPSDDGSEKRFLWEIYNDLNGDGSVWTQPNLNYYYWNTKWEDRAAQIGFTAYGPADVALYNSANGAKVTGSEEDIYWYGTSDPSIIGTSIDYSPLKNEANENIYTAGFAVDKTVKNQKDLVVARQFGSRLGNSTSGVPLNFEHALSQIVVRGTNKNTEERRVEVIGVKLVQAYSQGTLVFPRAATSAGTFQWADPAVSQSAWYTAWGNSDATKYFSKFADYGVSRDLGDGAVVELGQAAKDLNFIDANGEGMFLLPQQLYQWNPDLTVTTSSPNYDMTDCYALSEREDSTNFPRIKASAFTAKQKTVGCRGAYIAVLCRITSLVDQDITANGIHKEYSAGDQVYPEVSKNETSYGYKYWNGDQQTGYNLQKNQARFAYTAIPINTKWLPGKKYVYTLNFYQGAGGAGILPPDQVDPDGKGHDIADLPFDPSERQPGKATDPWHNEPIFFTVTVSDWDGSNAQNLVMQ